VASEIERKLAERSIRRYKNMKITTTTQVKGLSYAIPSLQLLEVEPKCMASCCILEAESERAKDSPKETSSEGTKMHTCRIFERFLSTMQFLHLFSYTVYRWQCYTAVCYREKVY
jgi:hypothetical protein